MEDTVSIVQNIKPGYDYYAIYDGHGGDQVSKYCQHRMVEIIKETMKTTNDIRQILYMSFAQMSLELKGKPWANTTGSTALVIIKNDANVWVANLGDCRGVVKYFDNPRYKGKAISRDHKPNEPDERKRIENLGGFVIQDPMGTWRVMGNLAIGRSFGDDYLHPWVTWEPEITQFAIDREMRALILGSDGVWDTLSNQDAVDIAHKVIDVNMHFDQQAVLSKICQAIAREAQNRGSGDNISVIFIII